MGGQICTGAPVLVVGYRRSCFFRAGPDIGVKSVPRCPVSACKALCLNTTCKFLIDYAIKVDMLLEAAAEGSSTLAEVARILYSSPPMHSKQIMAEAFHLKYQERIHKARIKTDVNKIAHSWFLDVHMGQTVCF